MMAAAMAGLAGGTKTACTISGTLSASGGASTVTSSSRTVSLGLYNSGTLRIANIVNGGTAVEISVNGAAYTAMSNGSEYVFGDGQTIQVRATGLPALSSSAFDIYDDDTSTLLQSVLLERT